MDDSEAEDEQDEQADDDEEEDEEERAVDEAREQRALEAESDSFAVEKVLDSRQRANRYTAWCTNSSNEVGAHCIPSHSSLLLLFDCVAVRRSI